MFKVKTLVACSSLGLLFFDRSHEMSQDSQGWRTNLLFSSPASLYVCNAFFICAQSLISIQHEKSEPTVCDFRGRAELSQFAHFRITIKIGKESTAEKSEREPGEGDLTPKIQSQAYAPKPHLGAPLFPIKLWPECQKICIAPIAEQLDEYFPRRFDKPLHSEGLRRSLFSTIHR